MPFKSDFSFQWEKTIPFDDYDDYNVYEPICFRQASLICTRIEINHSWIHFFIPICLLQKGVCSERQNLIGHLDETLPPTTIWWLQSMFKTYHLNVVLATRWISFKVGNNMSTIISQCLFQSLLTEKLNTNQFMKYLNYSSEFKIDVTKLYNNRYNKNLCYWLSSQFFYH